MAIDFSLIHGCHESAWALPEDISSPAEEILLLLIAVRAHSPLNDGEQRLHQTQHKWTATLPGHEYLDQVQHLQWNETKALDDCCAGGRILIAQNSFLHPYSHWSKVKKALLHIDRTDIL